MGTHSNPVAWKPLCLACPPSPSTVCPLTQPAPDIPKVHHSPLHSEKNMNTPLCFPWRRRQRKCQVLYWWEIHSDCQWAGPTWAVGSAGATELENGPNNMLQSRECSRVCTGQGCILSSFKHFLWNISGSEKRHLQRTKKISPSLPGIGKLGSWTSYAPNSKSHDLGL